MTIRRIFIHGLESSSQGYKGRLLHNNFPDMIIPDFTGSLDERMAKLESIMAEHDPWIIVGSSFGGLMGALYACAHPEKVRRLILLAPALIPKYFPGQLPAPVDVETIVYHGESDDIIPIDDASAFIHKLFWQLTFHRVDDDHLLHPTVQAIDWVALL